MMNKTKLLLSALLVSGSLITSNMTLAQTHTPVEPPANTPNANDEAAKVVYQSALNFYLGKSGVEHNLDSARALMKQAADMGYARAQYHYANMVYYNHGDVFNDKLQREKIALDYYSKAVRQGNRSAYFHYGRLLLNADPTLQNHQLAVRYLNSFATNSRGTSAIAFRDGKYVIVLMRTQGPACLLMGDCYAYGKGVTRNKAKAIEWYKKAIDLGQRSAYTKIGDLLKSGEPTENDLGSAEIWYYKGMKAQSSTSMAAYANQLLTINYTRQRIKKGLDLLRQASAKGAPAANFYLSELYESGRFVKKDERTARIYLLRASARKYPPAMVKRADALMQSEAQNASAQRAAMKLYLEAADKDYLPAQRVVVTGYRFGKAPFTRNTGSALYWQKRVALQTQKAEDQYQVGLLNRRTALRLRWYRLAAAQGHFQASIRLKIAYANSVDQARAKENLDELIKLYNEGHEDLAIRIANIYLTSRHLKNPVLAMTWLNKAGQGGDASAYRRLGIMSVKGEGLAANLARARGFYMRAGAMGDVISLMELANAYDTQPNNLTREWVLGYQKLGKNKVQADLYWKRAADLGSREAQTILQQRQARQ